MQVEGKYWKCVLFTHTVGVRMRHPRPSQEGGIASFSFVEVVAIMKGIEEGEATRTKWDERYRKCRRT